MSDNKTQVKFYRGKVWKNPETDKNGEILFINDAFDSSLSKDTTEYESATKFGSIYQDDKIVGTTRAEQLLLTKPLTINGGPLSTEALTVFPDGIPAGTSMEEILTKLFLKELYPNAATLPTIDISGEKSFGLLEVGSSASIPTVSMTKDDGKFNASYSKPTQPSTDVTWSGESMSATVTGFTGATFTNGTTSLDSKTGTIVEGTNKVAYSASADYSAPSNTPLTNLDNNATDAGYTFSAGKATKTANTTATGVYPIYSNGIELTNTNTNNDATFGTNEINKMVTLINYWGGSAKKYIGFGGQSTNTWCVYLPSSSTLVSAKGYNPTTGEFDVSYTFTNAGTQSIDTTYITGVEYVKYTCSGSGAKNNVEFTINKKA